MVAATWLCNREDQVERQVALVERGGRVERLIARHDAAA